MNVKRSGGRAWDGMMVLVGGGGGGRDCTLHYTHSLVVGGGVRIRYSHWVIYRNSLANHINQFSV